MNSILIWYKEFKKENKKQFLLMIILLIIILSLGNIGNFARLKTYYNIDSSGYKEVIEFINFSHKEEFSNTFIIFSYCLPIIMLFFYLGFPHLVVLYKNEKESKNLYHLLSTPLGSKQLIFGYTTYCMLRTLIPSLLVFFINILVIKLFGVVYVVNIKLFAISTILMISMIFCILYFICSIIWITDGSKLVVTFSRVLLLLGMSGFYLLMGSKINLNWLIDWSVFAIAIIIESLLFIITRIIIRNINIEKIIIN